MKGLALAAAWFSLSLTSPSLATSWSWAGFEVLGNQSATRDEILRQIPLRIGDDYKEDLVEWEKWCHTLVETFAFSSAECSGVRYSDFKAFLVIDVVEKGDENRVRFRNLPSEDIVLADASVREIYRKLQARLWELFAQGKPPTESWNKGYLDYSDPQMHASVLELVKLTRPYRRNILQVLARDRDPVKRMAAADLLNWAGKGEQSVLRTHSLLNDPHFGVRNQLSRFMMHFVRGIQPERKLKRIVDSLLKQLDRPSHGDRNKALYNLLEIVETNPRLRRYVDSKGRDLIQYFADHSVLSNVAEPAKDLLVKIQNLH